ncbi:hypothetical protein Hanom_Chr05g00405631 [Helianthus anomalus]
MLFIFGLTFSEIGCCQNNIRTPGTTIYLYLVFYLFYYFYLFILNLKIRGYYFSYLHLSLLQVSL